MYFGETRYNIILLSFLNAESLYLSRTGPDGVLSTPNEKTYYPIFIPAQHPVSLRAIELFTEVYPEDVFQYGY
jgi:hypothetical protein